MYDCIYHFRSRDLNDFPDIVRKLTSETLAPETNAEQMYSAMQRYLFGAPPPPPPPLKQPPTDKTSETNMMDSIATLPVSRKHP
jgi:hypothetical protein